LKKIKLHIKQWIKAVIYAILTVVIIKAFFFWVYVIPSTSMEKTLLPGDLIFVNKMSYGVRMPITPLTFPLSHQKMPFSKEHSSYLDYIQFPYYRLFTSSINRNDVVVFNYPMDVEHPVDHRLFFIKRCIGLPGDTLKIQNKKVYINNIFLPYPKEVEFNYHVQTDTTVNFDSLSVYNISEGSYLGNELWQLTLSDSIKNRIAQLDQFKSVKPIKVDPKSFADYIFPYHKKYCWNIDNFGELIIPKKGVTVLLDTNNIHLYQRIIEVYEGFIRY
jgi:signal peptidase I